MKPRPEKTRTSTITASRKIVATENLNPNGTLFGGDLMAWIDEVAFMCARRFTGKPTCVTANIDNITFKTPLRLGEHIVLTSTINHVGQTSMLIEVLVEKEDPETHSRELTNSAFLTFVCLNKDFKPIPVPQLSLETREDQVKNLDALLRAKVRRRLERFLEKRSIARSEAAFASLRRKDSPRKRLGDLVEASLRRIAANREKAIAEWLARLERAL